MSGWAKTYSCRDGQGRLHFSDNLQGLPEECLGKAIEVKPGKADNLNFVPAQTSSEQTGHEFKQSVQDVDREIKRTKQQTKLLRARAEQLLERDREARQKKHKARRNWSYSSRQTIKQADEDIAQVRTEKQQLLQELDTSGLATGDKEDIRSLLDEIAEE